MKKDEFAVGVEGVMGENKAWVGLPSSPFTECAMLDSAVYDEINVVGEGISIINSPVGETRGEFRDEAPSCIAAGSVPSISQFVITE